LYEADTTSKSESPPCPIDSHARARSDSHVRQNSFWRTGGALLLRPCMPNTVECEELHLRRRVHRACTKPHPLPVTPPPTPHRRAGLRRPLRQHPDRHACGFSIASPRACHRAARLNMARPSGASFSPNNAPTSRYRPPPTPHRRGCLRRPLRRGPDRHALGCRVSASQIDRVDPII